MISDYRCFFCFVRAFEKLLEKENITNEAKASFSIDMIKLYQKRYKNFSAPLFSRELHKVLKNYTQNPDPYKAEKKKNNDQAINMLPELEGIIQKSDDPFSTALRLAIAGNIMDFAANNTFNLQATIDSALGNEFAIDNSDILKQRLGKAKTVLFLGDNAGEIVFDRLLIREINHPDLTYVVRGAPIINDATMEDADYTGMKETANVITSGYDAPSTIIDKSSKQFQQYFRESDIIISKGQGNLEGLLPLNDNRIFFLLMVKCDVIAEFLKVSKESFIVFNPSCSRIKS